MSLDELIKKHSALDLNKIISDQRIKLIKNGDYSSIDELNNLLTHNIFKSDSISIKETPESVYDSIKIKDFNRLLNSLESNSDNFNQLLNLISNHDYFLSTNRLSYRVYNFFDTYLDNAFDNSFNECVDNFYIMSIILKQEKSTHKDDIYIKFFSKLYSIDDNKTQYIIEKYKDKFISPKNFYKINPPIETRELLKYCVKNIDNRYYSDIIYQLFIDLYNSKKQFSNEVSHLSKKFLNIDNKLYNEFTNFVSLLKDVDIDNSSFKYINIFEDPKYIHRDMRIIKEDRINIYGFESLLNKLVKKVKDYQINIYRMSDKEKFDSLKVIKNYINGNSEVPFNNINDLYMLIIYNQKMGINYLLNEIIPKIKEKNGVEIC